MDMGEIGETLSKHYGPLPGYAWVGIGGLGIAVLVKLRGGSASPATDLAAAAPASDGSILGGGDMGGGGGGGGDLSAGVLNASDATDTGNLLAASQSSYPTMSGPGSLAASGINPNQYATSGIGIQGTNNQPISNLGTPTTPIQSTPAAGGINPNQYNPFQAGGVSGTQTQGAPGNKGAMLS